uniref:Ig-like domain-containing protein n=1 Tax=Monodelphis domestica TaxID=13616 RepID=A0A5F8GWM3_MONDO
MGTSLLCCVVVFLLTAVPTDARITQNLRYLVTATGREVTLRCEQDMGHDSMYWYRQDPGLGLQVISFSLNVGFSETETPYGYSASRKEKPFFLLTLKSTSTNQTSGYFCASSTTTEEQSHFFLAQKTAIRRDGMTQSHLTPLENKERRYFLRYMHRRP